MSRTIDDVLKLIRDREIKYVDLRFTDSRGKQQHLTIPAGMADSSLFEHGKIFDGSSIAGWKGISESDMILMPDPNTAIIDPFFDADTLVLVCDIFEPATMQGYMRDPRSLARRAEAYLQSTGIADTALFGPENEFFIFDDVRWGSDMSGSFYKVDSEEANWNAATIYADGNMGHRPSIRGGYFPVPPVDSLHDIRTTMCEGLEQMGLVVEVHHHEVASAGQCEIGVRFASLTQKADEVQTLKYVIQNVAHAYGKTATFMPKPIVGDNGSGMHVHQSLTKGGVNLFAGDAYGGLSELALYYIGGIIRHAHALNAFTNASTNSYKRLVPHFEAPVLLAYSANNRSAAIRIPYITDSNARRIEVRFPDSTANPYLAFSAMLMAGLDGIQNKIHPGDAANGNLYDLPLHQEGALPRVANSLEQSLSALNQDREFLTKGGVFTNDVIDAYIKLKMQDVQRLHMSTHPVEYDLYYSL